MKKLLIATAMLATASAAGAANIIVNGNFETGTLAGWTSASSGYAFYLTTNDGALAPTSHHPTPTNASGDTYFAMSDQSSQSRQVLIQSFTVAGGSQTLSFDWFNNNYTSFTAGGGLNSSSQTMRVDILTSGAASDDTGAGVVQNVLLNQTSSSWTNSLFNLSLAAGTYKLRFASAECCSFQNFGIDNVSLTEQVPEPAMLGLFGLGAVGLGLARRRKAA